MLSDNCNLNKSIVELIGNPQLGCINHKLNFDIKGMRKHDSILANCIDSVKNTMLDCKKSYGIELYLEVTLI